jgi:hypothetical protein
MEYYWSTYQSEWAVRRPQAMPTGGGLAGSQRLLPSGACLGAEHHLARRACGGFAGRSATRGGGSGQSTRMHRTTPPCLRLSAVVSSLSAVCATAISARCCSSGRAARRAEAAGFGGLAQTVPAAGTPADTQSAAHASISPHGRTHRGHRTDHRTQCQHTGTQIGRVMAIAAIRADFYGWLCRWLSLRGVLPVS